MIDLPSAWQMLKDGGALAALFLVLIGGYKGLFVFGPTHKALELDRDFWRQLALSGTSLAQKALDTKKQEVSPT